MQPCSPEPSPALPQTRSNDVCQSRESFQTISEDTCHLHQGSKFQVLRPPAAARSATSPKATKAPDFRHSLFLSMVSESVSVEPCLNPYIYLTVFTKVVPDTPGSMTKSWQTFFM